MEAAAGMLIHSTALRPITIWPSAHPQCVCNVCRCCVATVAMTGCVCESLVPYLVVPGQAVCFTRCHASGIVIGSRQVVIGHLFSDRPLIQRPLRQPLVQRPPEPEFCSHHLFSDWLPRRMRYTQRLMAPSGPSPPAITTRS